MRTLENTIVHELFHAFMDDYNRTGMAGSKVLIDVLTDDEGNFISEDGPYVYGRVHFPSWFVEGSASAVENVYQFRDKGFAQLCAAKVADEPIARAILYNYLNDLDSTGERMYFDLMYSEGYDGDAEVSNENSAYVCGYLATLYLSDLAQQKYLGGDEAVKGTGPTTVEISMDRLRAGLNAILEQCHNGKTLDAVIAEISTVDGAALYSDTNDFQAKFIKGAGTPVGDDERDYSDDPAQADRESLYFVSNYLIGLMNISDESGRQNKANGSILLDADADVMSPLKDTGEYTSDYYRIAGENGYVESTVPNSVALAGGGKSDPPDASASAIQTAAAKAEAELPLAAKCNS